MTVMPASATSMANVFARTAPRISFEFFPPKTAEMEEKLWQAVIALTPLSPKFVSVTYGAGGSTRERTHHTVMRIAKETPIAPAAHLTCVAASQAEINEIAAEYWVAGIRHLVALRGDPQDGKHYIPHPQGYKHASDLVHGLKRIADFEISVAAFPEGHPETPGVDADILNLKRKMDAGADRAITQYFFDVEHFLRYRDKAVAAGINIPILPGILPVTNYSQVVKFSAMCGATVPAWLARLFEGVEHDPVTRNLVAATVTAEQCRLLRVEGVEDFHFYTLNRAELTLTICHILGVRPEVSLESA